MTSDASSVTWEEFADAVSVIVDQPPEGIAPDSALVDDLGFDSLAIAELAVTLIDDYGLEITSSELADIEWRHITAGLVFERYVSPRTGPHGRDAAIPRGA